MAEGIITHAELFVLMFFCQKNIPLCSSVKNMSLCSYVKKIHYYVLLSKTRPYVFMSTTSAYVKKTGLSNGESKAEDGERAAMGWL